MAARPDRRSEVGQVLYHRVRRPEACERTFKARKRRPKSRPPGELRIGLLESQSRPEGNPQIVMRAVLEVDFVAHLGAQSDRSDKAL